MGADLNFLTPGNPAPGDTVMAPSPVYLTGEEALRVTTVTSFGPNLCTINGRILRPNGSIVPLNEVVTTNSNRAAVATIKGLCEGWLLGLTIRASSGSPSFGQAWAMLELVRGQGSSAQLVQTLGAGFFTANTPFYVPGGPNALPLDGPGFLRSITGATPAAGAEISETVPTGARWELLAFVMRFVASAAAANRDPVLTFDDGATLYARAGWNALVVASTTIDFDFEQGFAAPWNDQAGHAFVPIPMNIRLGAGHRIRTVTTNLQVGDQYSAVQYLVREWLTVE